MADLGRRLAYPGALRTARVSATGPSGRATQVTLDGDAGPALIDGLMFASRLGLKSTLLTAHPETREPPPLAVDTVDPGVTPSAPNMVLAVLGAARTVQALASERSPGSPGRRLTPVLLVMLIADAACFVYRGRRRRDTTAA